MNIFNIDNYEIIHTIKDNMTYKVYIANNKTNKRCILVETSNDSNNIFDKHITSIIKNESIFPTINNTYYFENKIFFDLSYVEGNFISDLKLAERKYDEEIIVEWGRKLSKAFEQCDYDYCKTDLYDNIYITSDNNLIFFGIFNKSNKNSIIDSVYEIGNLMFYLLTGSEYDVFNPSSLLEYNNGISPCLNEIIQKCLVKDESNYFESYAGLFYSLVSYKDIDYITNKTISSKKIINKKKSDIVPASTTYFSNNQEMDYLKPLNHIPRTFDNDINKVLINPEFLDQYTIDVNSKKLPIFRKKRTIRIPKKLFATLLTLISISISLFYSDRLERYNTAINLAEINTKMKMKIEKCIDATHIMPGEIKSYHILLNTFISDNKFTLDEEKKLLMLLEKNWSFLENNFEFSQLLFEIGKAYLFYSDYGLTNPDTNLLLNSSEYTNNTISKYNAALPFFKNSILYAEKTSPYYSEAIIYRDIAEFNTDIKLRINEGIDSNEFYVEHWNTIVDLTYLTQKHTSNKTIESLTLYNIILNSIESLFYQFQESNITNTDIKEIVDNINYEVKDINCSSKKEKQLLEEIALKIVLISSMI